MPQDKSDAKCTWAKIRVWTTKGQQNIEATSNEATNCSVEKYAIEIYIGARSGARRVLASTPVQFEEMPSCAAVQQKTLTDSLAHSALVKINILDCAFVTFSVRRAENVLIFLGAGGFAPPLPPLKNNFCGRPWSTGKTI